MKTAILATLLTLSASITSAASLGEHAPNTRGLQVIPMPPSPDPDYVTTTILYPKDKELRTSSPIKGQIKIEGYPLGTDTEMPRKTEIWNDPEGQSLHIFVDNEPYFAVNEALINALDDVEDYFDETADFTIPFKLEAGMHILRVFPVRSFNESIKSGGAFTSSTFYYKAKKENLQVDLSAPYLTYNEPQGEYDYDRQKDQPILLDFYLTNCNLSRDGYKVRLSIDNDDRRTLSAWQPYYIYGLSKGVHKIRLELLDPQNTLVPGPFNDVTRTITIK